MKKISLILLAFILKVSIVIAQDYPAFHINTGGGFFESIHLGCKVQVTPKNQIGFYYGNALMLYRYKYNSFTVDHQYHFGRVSVLSNRAVWYCRQGLSYSIDNAAYSETKYIFGSVCLGREFNISPKFGLNFDIGLSRTLMEKELVKDASIEPWFDIKISDLEVFPSLRFQLYYSF